MSLNTESEDKLPCLENGSIRHENGSNISFMKRLKRNSSCSQLLQIAKVVLYFELGFLIGWIGCVYLWNSMGNNNHNDIQSETVHSFGSSAVKFMPPDFNHFMDFEYTMTINRGKRSTDETEIKREACMRSVNATRESFQQLMKQIIIGDDANQIIIMLREKCRLQMVGVTTRVMMMILISRFRSPRPTDEDWSSLALSIKEGIMNDTAGEYRQLVEASGPPTPQMINDLRTVILSMITNYKNCEKILPFGEPSTEPSLADALNVRDKCMRMIDVLKEDLRPLEAQIVPGNASDPIVVELRGKVENMAVTMLTALIVRSALGENITAIAAQNASLTDAVIQQHLDAVKAHLKSDTDAEHQRQIDESGPLSPEMVNQIRTLLNKNVNDIIECNNIQHFIEQLRASEYGAYSSTNT